MTALWLPIVISGVVLFFASFIAWTILPHHQADWKKLDNEEALMDKVRELDIPPGNYMFPYTTHKEGMKDPKFEELYKTGPRGTLNTWGMPNMGMNMFCTFLFFLVTAAIIGYVSFAAIGRGASFMHAFQIVGTIGILTYSSAGIPNGIWFKRNMLNDIIDGIVYGLIIGLLFAVMWPK